MLIYRCLPNDPASIATLIGLHGRGADLDQLGPLCGEAAPSFELVTPQAARPINAVLDGYPLQEEGFTWYWGEEVCRPEPATFGESLWQLEQFVCDVRDRHNVKRSIFLVGHDQGAVLAATTVGIMPELLTGVVVICGCLPEIRGWSLPVENAEGLPVLLMHDPEDTQIPLALVQRTAKEFARRNAQVELRQLLGIRRDPLIAANVLKQWLVMHLLGNSSAEKAYPSG